MKISTAMTGTALLLGLGLLSGCSETIDSQNLRTQGIAAIIRATATSDSDTTLNVTLKAGGDESNTYVALGGGDRIFAEGDDKRVEMQQQSTGVYESRFGAAKADTLFKVDLQREEDDDAPSSTGNLPAPFTIEPFVMKSVSRTTELRIKWTPADDGATVAIHITGFCIFPEDIDVGGDPGEYVVPAGRIKPTNSDKPQSCNTEVEITRKRTGKADSTFDSESSFVLEQVRKATFTSSP